MSTQRETKLRIGRMNDETMVRASIIFEKLTRQINARNQGMLYPSELFLLREGLNQAAQVFNWTKNYGLSEAKNDIVSLSITGFELELEAHALALARVLQTKRDLRESIHELRDLISQGDYPFEFTYSQTFLENGAYGSREFQITITNKEMALELLERLEQMLENEGDITESIIIDLQQAQQELSQCMSTISNIIKMWHDELKSILTNLKA